MELLPNLLPVGGASAIFLYLLSVLVRRESGFQKERRELIAEHRRERDEDEGRWERQRADLEQWNQRLRTRIGDLEAQIDGLRTDLRGCHELIDELRNELRGSV